MNIAIATFTADMTGGINFNFNDIRLTCAQKLTYS